MWIRERHYWGTQDQKEILDLNICIYFDEKLYDGLLDATLYEKWILENKIQDCLNLFEDLWTSKLSEYCVFFLVQINILQYSNYGEILMSNYFESTHFECSLFAKWIHSYLYKFLSWKENFFFWKIKWFEQKTVKIWILMLFGEKQFEVKSINNSITHFHLVKWKCSPYRFTFQAFILKHAINNAWTISRFLEKTEKTHSFPTFFPYYSNSHPLLADINKYYTKFLKLVY